MAQHEADLDRTWVKANARAEELEGLINNNKGLVSGNSMVICGNEQNCMLHPLPCGLLRHRKGSVGHPRFKLCSRCSFFLRCQCAFRTVMLALEKSPS